MKKFLLAVCLFLGATFYVKGAFVFSGGTVAQLLQTPPTVTSTNIYCTGVTADQDGYAGIFSYYPAIGPATNAHDVFVWGSGRLIRTLPMTSSSILTNTFTNVVIRSSGSPSNSLTVLDDTGHKAAILGYPHTNVYVGLVDGSLYFPATNGTLGALDAITSITIGSTNGNGAGIALTGDQTYDNTIEFHNYYSNMIQAYVHSDGLPGFRSPTIKLFKSLGTQSAPLAVQSGNRLMQFVIGGYNGSSYDIGAAFYAYADENWGPSNEGTELDIGLNAAGTGIPTWYPWKMKDYVSTSEGGLDIASNISAHTTLKLGSSLTLSNATIVSSNVNLILPRATNVVGGVFTDVKGDGVITLVVPNSGGVAGSVVSSGLTPGVVPVASGATNLSDGYFQLSGGFIVPLINATNPFGSQTNAVKSVTIDGGNITVTTNYPQSFIRMKQNNASGSYTNRVSWIDDNLQSSLLTSFHDIWITKSRGIVASIDETGLFNAAGGVSSAGVGTFTGGVSAGGSLMSALAVSGALSSATFTLATTNLQTTLTSLQSQINNTPPSLINRVATTFAKSADTTPATVTGTSITLASSTKYIIKIFLLYSADATGGVAISTGGTATATDVGFAFNIKDVSTTALTALDSSLAVSHTLTGTLSGMATYEGAINVNAGGTFLITFAQSVANGTSSILRNSYISATVSPN